jgi:sugar phosphate isomerase/epimerase
MAELGIEGISAFGMPLPQFVELAAELGCPNVSISLQQMECDPYGFPRYSLPKDAHLQREVKAALAANGVALSLGENMFVTPEGDARDMWKAGLDIFAELGATRVNSVSFAPDFQRNVDQYGLLAELTASYGIRTLIEFVPIFGVPDMASALEVVRQVGHPNIGLIFDTMHAGRTGFAPETLGEIPPGLIQYIQLCDVPRGQAHYDFMDAGYMDEAMHQRLSPGDGAMPLADYMRELPRDVVIGLEIPRLDRAKAGTSLRDGLGECVAATRELLAGL